jgi:RNA polymerase sigma-70 factor, ECF subfamily
VAASTVTADERLLVARARRGDPAAFEALVRAHAAYAYNLALRTLGDPRDAEEAAQDAFVRAWRGLATFREDARFGTWLYRIVVRVCYDRLPRLRRDLAALGTDAGVDVPDGRQDVDARVLTDALRAELHAAIAALPADYRLLITLRHLQEMSYEDIAMVTGMPLGTVKVGIFRARRVLRAVLTTAEVADG